MAYPPQPPHDPQQVPPPPYQQVPPQYPQALPPQQPRRVVTKSGISGMGTATHLMLTLFTCGCWLPVWFLHWLFTRNRQVTTHY